MIEDIISAMGYYWNVARNESVERQEIKYTIASECYNEREKVFYATLTVKGLARPITKRVKDIFNREWLSRVHAEDAARLAFLSYIENSGQLEIYSMFPVKKSRITKSAIFLMMLFVASLIVSNLTGFKIVCFDIFGYKLNIPGGLIFFPFTYIFDDVITEVYGYAVSRIVIWGGLLASLMVTLCLHISVYTPAASFWHYQSEYALVFSHPFRIMLASFSAYFVGEFLNSYIISRMKVLTNGKYFAMRIITGTSVGALFDSIIFGFLAFYGLYDNVVIMQMIVLQYLFKVGYEVLALPITYFISGYLKKKDKIDYYDIETSYNPFSILNNKSVINLNQ